jgi:hypothetical protein
VDSINKVHISYYDATNQDQKYATNASGSWVTQTIDSEGNVGGFTSLAVDSNNKVHISYGGGYIKYATNTSGLWLNQTVDVGYYPSLAVDSNNKVHISYSWGGTNYDFMYATNASGPWVTQTIESSPNTDVFPSIAVDSNNKIHISYCNLTDGAKLKYATNASGLWVTQILDSGVDAGWYNSIALDSNNNVHISYNWGGTNGDLKYATNTSTYSALTILSPNGEEVIPSGSTYSIQWSAPPEAVKFTLRYSINNGSTWKLIAKNVTGTSYDWTVPIPNNNKKNCLVKVIGFNAGGTKVGEDISDSTFTIEVVKLTLPNGGEILTSGTMHTITWTTNATKNPVASTKLFRSINGGSTWTSIKTLTGNPGSYNWTVPNVSSSNCKVKVVLKDSSNVTVGSDVSDANFTIQP